MISSLISALSYLKTNRMVIELLLISQLHHWFQRAYLKESLKRNGDGDVHDVTKFYMCTEWQFYESTSQTSTLDQIIRSKGPFHHHTMRRLFHHGGRTGKRVRRELQVASLSTRNRENSSTWFSWTTSSWNAANYLTIYFIYLSIYIYIAEISLPDTPRCKTRLARGGLLPKLRHFATEDLSFQLSKLSPFRPWNA